ncbi:MAG: hypothetical protein N2484_08410 [Clostridia bacterium]|nr:hypothetical protein [Clostridia bacterium]
MGLFEKTIENIVIQYHRLKRDRTFASNTMMPGKAYFIDDNNILSIPRDDGDCRYPYGKNGANFWAYSSGYMHGNEGLFSAFLRAGEGQEPKIAFFAGLPGNTGKYRIIPLLSVPVMDNEIPVERYTVFTKNCVYYITETEDFRFAVRVFHDQDRNIHFSIRMENLTYSNQQFFISAYLNPFLSHNLFENSENRWFREVRYIGAAKEGDLGRFYIKVNEDLNRTTSVYNIGVASRNIYLDEKSRITSHEETTSRYQYVGGSRSSLHSPSSLEKGTFGEAKHVCSFTEVAVLGDIIHLEMCSQGKIRYDISFSYRIHCKNENEASALLQKAWSREAIDSEVLEAELQEKKADERLSCKVLNVKQYPMKQEVFKAFFKHLKKQVEFCSLIKGYVQLWAGSLIGIRDIFQAIEGFLLWNPEAARDKMLEAFNFILIDGRCPRQYSLPTREDTPPVMDLRPFIDQGCWLISTVVSYIKFTGDKDFLSQECGYYEISDEKKGLVVKSRARDSVMDHLLKVMEYLLSNRDFEMTGCIKALYGDWNDALDGLGVSIEPDKEYGSGVSMMASLQVYHNLSEMIELLNWTDKEKYASYVANYKLAVNELERNIRNYGVICSGSGEPRIVHGWGDKRSYLVGSFKDPDGQPRIGLTSNAFWILSKLYDKDVSIKNTILDAFAKLDTKYGFKTFEPYFSPNTPGVGRIPKLPAGTAENGAVYIHASAFAVMALFRIGCPEYAWEQLYKLLPITHEKISCSPFVMPNSYGFNEEKRIDGESMHDWQTGSSNVILKTLIKYVFGFEAEFEGVWIQPAGFNPFGSFEFSITVYGCKLTIAYEDKCSGARTYKVNNIKRKSVYDEVMGLEKLWIPKNELKCSSLDIFVED